MLQLQETFFGRTYPTIEILGAYSWKPVETITPENKELSWIQAKDTYDVIGSGVFFLFPFDSTTYQFYFVANGVDNPPNVAWNPRLAYRTIDVRLDEVKESNVPTDFRDYVKEENRTGAYGYLHYYQMTIRAGSSIRMTCVPDKK